MKVKKRILRPTVKLYIFLIIFIIILCRIDNSCEGGQARHPLNVRPRPCIADVVGDVDVTVVHQRFKGRTDFKQSVAQLFL